MWERRVELDASPRPLRAFATQQPVLKAARFRSAWKIGMKCEDTPSVADQNQELEARSKIRCQLLSDGLESEKGSSRHQPDGADADLASGLRDLMHLIVTVGTIVSATGSA